VDSLTLIFFLFVKKNIEFFWPFNHVGSDQVLMDPINQQLYEFSWLFKEVDLSFSKLSNLVTISVINTQFLWTPLLATRASQDFIYFIDLNMYLVPTNIAS